MCLKSLVVVVAAVVGAEMLVSAAAAAAGVVVGAVGMEGAPETVLLLAMPMVTGMRAALRQVTPVAAGALEVHTTGAAASEEEAEEEELLEGVSGPRSFPQPEQPSPSPQSERVAAAGMGQMLWFWRIIICATCRRLPVG